jgi:hypothetical protein
MGPSQIYYAHELEQWIRDNPSPTSGSSFTGLTWKQLEPNLLPVVSSRRGSYPAAWGTSTSRFCSEGHTRTDRWQFTTPCRRRALIRDVEWYSSYSNRNSPAVLTKKTQRVPTMHRWFTIQNSYRGNKKRDRCPCAAKRITLRRRV